jgi:endonuclease/exonuclease/phosphatase family metal-dependent hydrolase
VRRPHAVLAIMLMVLFVASCAHPHAATTGIALRVMTYNIAAGHGDLERVAEAIRVESPDIVALQEVDVHWSARSGFADQATVLGERLRMQVRFARIYSLEGATAGAPPREYGLALLSKYPIDDFRNHLLTRLSTVQEGTPPAPMPGFLEAHVNVAGTRVRVFDTHTDYRQDPSVRVRQVAEMLAIVGETLEPTLLFGDLNAPPNAAEMQPLLRKLRDSWTTPEQPGLTYPSNVPVKRIDYVLTSEHFRVRSIWVPVTEASDHRPVVADLMLAPHRN